MIIFMKKIGAIQSHYFNNTSMVLTLAERNLENRLVWFVPEMVTLLGKVMQHTLPITI